MSYYVTKRRSVVKSITFRILIVMADGVIIYTITKSLALSLSVIILSNISSTIIYFVHERVWNNIKWGKGKRY
jgi:uncharacterized membrane protein